VFKRQQRILQLLQENHEMSVEDLSKELEVSEITIRRDLQQFEDQGVVERFYGGARFLTGKIKQEFTGTTFFEKTLLKNIFRSV